MSRSKKKLRIVHPNILLFLALALTSGYSAPVTPNEAIAIADLWYAMELNSGYLKITDTERTQRFQQMGNREVYYMVDKDELEETYPVDRPVFAYIITYSPDGFVVVSS